MTIRHQRGVSILAVVSDQRRDGLELCRTDFAEVRRLVLARLLRDDVRCLRDEVVLLVVLVVAPHVLASEAHHVGIVLLLKFARAVVMWARFVIPDATATSIGPRQLLAN